MAVNFCILFVLFREQKEEGEEDNHTGKEKEAVYQTKYRKCYLCDYDCGMSDRIYDGN